MIAIRGGTVYTMAGPPIPNGTVLIAEGKIVSVGGAELPVPSGTEIIDAAGCWVTPGFIDAHCHTDFYAEHLPDACGKALQGVTTDVCGLCGDSAAPIGRKIWNFHSNTPREVVRLPEAIWVRTLSMPVLTSSTQNARFATVMMTTKTFWALALRRS